MYLFTNPTLNKTVTWARGQSCNQLKHTKRTSRYRLVMGIVPKIEERNEPANLEKKNGTRNAGSR